MAKPSRPATDMPRRVWIPQVQDEAGAKGWQDAEGRSAYALLCGRKLHRSCARQKSAKDADRP